MAYELIGAGGLTVELKQYYSRVLLERAMPNLVWLQRGFGRTDAIPTMGGKSIEWRRFERPSAITSALTEGTPGAETNLTVSNVQATVSQYGAYVIYSDLVNTQAIDPVVRNYAQVFGEQMAISLDTIVRNVAVAGTTVQYASTAGSRGGVGSGMRMTYAEIREAVATLKKADAPTAMDGLYVGVIHPDTESDMMSDSDIITSLQNAGVRGTNNPLFQGDIGTFYKVNWIVTSLASVGTSLGLSGADVYYSVVFGAGYYGTVDLAAHPAQVIIKPVGSAGAADPLNQRGTVGWKAAIAAARLDENRAVRIEHTSALGTE